MTHTISATPRWEARPKNDRLKRWCIVDAASPGRGKTVIADNVRSESNARRIAASLDLVQALKASRAVLTSILGTDTENAIIAEQVAVIDAAIAKAEVAA